jgi:hypothetical protein
MGGAMAATLRVCSKDRDSEQACVALIGMAGMGSAVTQGALARRRSVAARSLGLGMKGTGRCVAGTGIVIVIIVVFIFAQTVKMVAVARGRFTRMHRSQVSVMRSGMVLAEVVCLVECTLVPREVELSLLHLVAHPAESHVHGFGSLLLDGIACDTSGRAAVGFGNCRRLWVACFLKHCSDWACFFAVVKEGTKFGFGGAGCNFTHDGAKGVLPRMASPRQRRSTRFLNLPLFWQL